MHLEVYNTMYYRKLHIIGNVPQVYWHKTRTMVSECHISRPGVWNRILLSGISKEGSRKRTKSGCLVLDLVPYIYNSPAISQLVAPSRIELLSKV